MVNNQDQIIGEARRSEVHGNPGLIHRVSHVLVFNSRGELYLQKRSLTKDVQPGKWDTSVGGHLDKGESYLEAAKREMKEEIGIETDDIQFLYKYLHSNQYESEYVSTFHCLWDGVIMVNEDEIAEGKFWTLDEIMQQSDLGCFSPNFMDELSRYIKYA